MSSVGKYLWLKGHKFELEDRMLTACLVDMLLRRGKSSRNVADDLGLEHEKIRNWFYRKTRVSGLDFLLAQTRYGFVRKELLSTYDDVAGEYHIKYGSIILLPEKRQKI